MKMAGVVMQQLGVWQNMDNIKPAKHRRVEVIYHVTMLYTLNVINLMPQAYQLEMILSTRLWCMNPDSSRPKSCFGDLLR